MELFGLGKRFIAKAQEQEVKIVTCSDLNCVGRGDTNASSSHAEKARSWGDFAAVGSMSGAG